MNPYIFSVIGPDNVLAYVFIVLGITFAYLLVTLIVPRLDRILSAREGWRRRRGGRWYLLRDNSKQRFFWSRTNTADPPEIDLIKVETHEKS